MTLLGFWGRYGGRGFHPDDEPHLHPRHVLEWTETDVRTDRARLERTPGWQARFHRNLLPQPFVGNPEHARVFILHGNPGFDFSEYFHEKRNSAHVKAISGNLAGRSRDFYFLGSSSDGTGGERYWSSRLCGLINAIAERGRVSIGDSRSIVRRNLCVLEAQAYHSKRSPGGWAYRLPSSRIAREFVRSQ